MPRSPDALPEVFRKHQVVAGLVDLRIEDEPAVRGDRHAWSAAERIFFHIAHHRCLLRCKIEELESRLVLWRRADISHKIQAIAAHREISPVVLWRLIQHFYFIS